VLGDRKQDILEADAQIQGVRESIKEIQEERLRSARGTAKAEEDCKRLEDRMRMLQQEICAAKDASERCLVETKAQAQASETLRGSLLAMEMQRVAFTGEVETARRRIAEVEAAIVECKDHSIQAFKEKDNLLMRVKEQKAEEQQLGAYCGALRRARHAEELAMEDLQTELQMAFRRREALMEDIAVSNKAITACSTQLHQLRPEIEEADQRSGRLEMSLAQKSKDLEDELWRERTLRQDLKLAGHPASPAAVSPLRRPSPEKAAPSPAPSPWRSGRSPSPPAPASQDRVRALAAPLSAPGAVPPRRALR
ncbi:unnamed protein product, partial [Effrenium voratum]